MMAFKRKHIVIVALPLCGMAILAWAIGSYLSNRAKQEQYQQALAQQYDKVLDVAYPLLKNYAIAINDKVDSIETIARKAIEEPRYDYHEAFFIRWQRYSHTESGMKGFVLLEEYQYFRMSPIFKFLMNACDKRKKEAEAIQKMTMAGQLLLDPVQLPYDSLMSVTKQARQLISDGLEVIEPYHSENTNIRAWRNIR